MTDNLPTLGARLRWAREQAGLSGAQVARQLGVGRAFIGAIEFDRVAPNLARLTEFRDLYGVSMDWLTTGTEATVDPIAGEERLDPQDRALVRTLISRLGQR